MLCFRPLCAAPLGAWQFFGELAVISTIRGSQHPVDCYVEGSQPTVYEIRTEWEVPRGGRKEKVTISTGGVRKLSKVVPSFTSITRKGGAID